jgi:hypothetical protein
MLKIQRAFFLSLFLGAFSCSVSAAPDEPVAVQKSQFATEIPDFSTSADEVEISSTFKDADATWVLGAIIDTERKSVHGLDSYLKTGISPTREKLTGENVFESYVDKSLTAKAGWLSFLKANVSNTQKAHVIFVKDSKATIDNQSIDKDKLIADAQRIPENKRGKYGLITGYVVYKLDANVFDEASDSAEAGATGIAVDGQYYKKIGQNTTVYKVIALWTPLPFAVAQVKQEETKNLATATATAIENREIKVKPIVGEIKAQEPSN